MRIAPCFLFRKLCLFLRLAPGLHLNAPRIAFTPLPYPYPLEQIKTPWTANFCVILAHRQGIIALALCNLA